MRTGVKVDMTLRLRETQAIQENIERLGQASRLASAALGASRGGLTNREKREAGDAIEHARTLGFFGGPDQGALAWTRYEAHYGEEASVSLTWEEVEAAQMTDSDFRFIRQELLGLLRHGRPIPPGVMCDYWMPLARAAKTLTFARNDPDSVLFTPALLAKAAGTQVEHHDPYFTVYNKGTRWWIRAEKSERHPHTLGPNGDMTGATLEANLRRKNTGDRWPSESWKRARGTEGEPEGPPEGAAPAMAPAPDRGLDPLWEGYRSGASAGPSTPPRPAWRADTQWSAKKKW